MAATHNIESVDDLLKIGADGTGYALSDDYILVNGLTINFDDYSDGWTPIGTSADPFTGTVTGTSSLAITFVGSDGNGKFNTSAGSGSGLFGNVKDATFDSFVLYLHTDIDASSSDNVGLLAGYAENTRVTGVNVTATVLDFDSASVPSLKGKNNVGGLIGHMKGSSFLGKTDGASSATNMLSQISVEGTDNVGGFVGLMETSTSSFMNGARVSAGIFNFFGSVNATGDNAGGFAGKATFSENQIFNYNVHADITAKNNAGGYFGSLELTKVTDDVSVSATDSIFTGNVTADLNNAGGRFGYVVIGADTKLLLEGSTGYGTIIANGEHAGGFIGSAGDVAAVDALNITYGVFLGSVEASSKAGGFIGYMDKGTLLNSRFSGTVHANDNIAGGFIGEMATGIITGALTSGTVTAEDSNAGGLVGSAGDLALSTARGTGTVSATNIAGGLVGYMEQGTLTQSFTNESSTTTATLEKSGGLVGQMNDGSITLSYSSGAVIEGGFDGTTSDLHKGLGGLVGHMADGTVENCFSNATLNGAVAKTGGLVGNMVAGDVKTSYAAVSAPDASGAIAAVKAAGSITDCFFVGATYDDTNGGTVKTSADMMKQATFTAAGWNIALYPKINENWVVVETVAGQETLYPGAYPVFSWMRPFDYKIYIDGNNLDARFFKIGSDTKNTDANGVERTFTTHAHYVLTENVVLNSLPNTIGGQTFTGTFDGNGKTITIGDGTDTSIVLPTGSKTYGYGLFESVGNGVTIKNLDIVVNNNLTASGAYAGVLIGNVRSLTLMNNPMSISNVSLSSAKSISSGTNYVGGLIGCVNVGANRLFEINDTNVSISINTAGTGNYKGGLTALAQNVQFINCHVGADSYYETNPIVISSKGSYIGGLSGSLIKSEVLDCSVNNVNLVSTNENVGGLSGYFVNSDLDNISLNNINIESTGKAGGLVSSARHANFVAKGSIDNPIKLNGINVKGATNASGFVGEISQSAVIIDYVELSDIVVESSTNYAGGIIGSSKGTPLFISNTSVLNAKISAGKSDVGGLVGMFNASKAYIDSSSVMDSTIKSDGDHAGGLVGNAARSACTYLNNSTFSGTVTADGLSAGGLGGYLSHTAYVNDCHSEGTVTSGITKKTDAQGYAGGLIGRALHLTLIENCTSDADVSGYDGVGGLIGRTSNKSIEIRESYTNGTVSGNNNIGGLVGVFENGSIADCYSNAHVSAANESAGGIVGRVDLATVIDNCYSTGNVTAVNKNAGGIVGYVSRGAAAVDVINMAVSHSITNSTAINYVVSAPVGSSRVIGAVGPVESGIYEGETISDNYGWLGISGFRSSDADLVGKSVKSVDIWKTFSAVPQGQAWSTYGAVWTESNDPNYGFPILENQHADPSADVTYADPSNPNNPEYNTGNKGSGTDNKLTIIDASNTATTGSTESTDSTPPTPGFSGDSSSTEDPIEESENSNTVYWILIALGILVVAGVIIVVAKKVQSN